MNIGIIGAGRVGCSIGKYLTLKNVPVTGYYSRDKEHAKWAADFTSTDYFSNLEELVALSDTLFITTTDDSIKDVWDCIKEMSIENKVICHFSGSLSSVVFSDIEGLHAYGASLHPMLAFNNKQSSYEQLNNAFLTAEGDLKAVKCLKTLFEGLGNRVKLIDKDSKVKYHAAASMLSNDVLGVLYAGYGLLTQCGFTENEALEATKTLVLGNVNHAISLGIVEALTGPIERNDINTVVKHLEILDDGYRDIYMSAGRQVLSVAIVKHPEFDYEAMKKLLEVI